MINVTHKVTGSGDKAKLVIEVDLSQRHGLSSSWKTVTIASTEGNQKIGHGDVVLGLSVYTKDGIADIINKAIAEGESPPDGFKAPPGVKLPGKAA